MGTHRAANLHGADRGGVADQNAIVGVRDVDQIALLQPRLARHCLRNNHRQRAADFNDWFLHAD